MSIYYFSVSENKSHKILLGKKEFSWVLNDWIFFLFGTYVGDIN